MADRFLVWLGAGVVTAGLSAAMLAGAGLASADTESRSDGGATTSSESAKPAEKQADSQKHDTAKADPKPPSGSAADVDRPKPDTTKPAERETEETDEVTTEDPSTEDESSSSTQSNKGAKTPTDHHVTAVSETKTVVAKKTSVTSEPEVQPDLKPVKPTPEPAQSPADQAPVVGPAVASRNVVTDVETAESTAPTVAPLAMVAAQEPASAVATAPTPPSLVNVIGTLIFTLYNLATRLFEGPPVLPPGSTVTVRTSTLHIDYGPGYDLPANWYFPDDANPTGLIYLQHGFLASAPFYSYTAATLAEQTHSIVVAPSVTSNFFAYDGFWLGGAPYQQAVADLFAGERQSLTDSASAAIGHAVVLPQRFVIAGHSAGGGLALAAAGRMDSATIDNLAGLVLLDGVALEGASTVFDNIPDGLPVYQISSPPYAWNMYGATSDALVQARPGRFNGVELVGGSHIDAMQGGNPLIQFGAYLVAGFSQPQNIEAVNILAVGWINDMFAGTMTKGIYGDPGEPIQIPIGAGTATAIALPASEASLSPLDQLLRWWFVTGSQALFDNVGAMTGTAAATKSAIAA